MPYSGYPRPPQVSLRESRCRLTADSRCKPGGEIVLVHDGSRRVESIAWTGAG
jgi:hypothetical protein